MLSVLINTHMLRAAVKHRSKRYFYSSSACVYSGDKQKTFEAPSLKEEDAYPALAEDGYGWEKLFSERMCRHFREDFGLYTRVARLHNVYGPWGTWYGGREKAPAAICREVIEAKISGKHEIEIWGPGNQTRSFMYIAKQRQHADSKVSPLGAEYVIADGTGEDLSVDLRPVFASRKRRSGHRSSIRGRRIVWKASEAALKGQSW